MNLYVVGYGSHEESERVVLTHSKCYNQEQFEEAIILASISVVRARVARRGTKDEDGEDHYDYTHNFQDILDDVVEKLTTDHFAFKRVEYNAEVMPFGWPSIFTRDDWVEQRGADDDFLNRLTDRLNAAGYTAKYDSHLSDDE